MRLPALPLLALALAAPSPAADGPEVEARYHRRTFEIPMRDGVCLHTTVYVPRDLSTPRPLLLERTPYGPRPGQAEPGRAWVGPAPCFTRQDYLVAYQDVRGRGRSGGRFVDLRPARTDPAGTDEATDTWDTLQWLLEHVRGHNGRAGIWGVSYGGFYAVQALRSAHPALRAVSPQAPMVDLWEGDDTYRRGAFQLAATFSFLQGFHSDPHADLTPVLPEDGYRWFLAQGSLEAMGAQAFKGREPIWTDVLRHTSRDAWWRARDLRPALKGVRPAVLTVGGWFDAEDLFGTLACHRTLVQASPRARARLVMGPWSHGQWAGEGDTHLGDVDFGVNPAPWFQQEVLLPFFDHHLKGAPEPSQARVLAFVTGTRDWRSFPAWPPPGLRREVLRLHPDGHLALGGPPAPSGEDPFPSDPRNPVPYTARTAFHPPADYMAEDQSFLAGRPDVLAYATEPLETDVTLAGPVRPRLLVSTTGTDADWVVKLIDVAPPGPGRTEPRRILVRGGVIRGKFRRSFSRPAPFVPGRAEEVAFDLDDVCHTFRKGHRIMVQVQGSWFPLVDANPQVFCDIPRTGPGGARAARHTLHLAGCALEVGLLPPS